MSTELTIPQRAAVALGSSETEVQLRELVASSADIVAVIDQAGRDQAHRIGMNLRTARTSIQKIGKAAREDAQAFTKAVIAEENRLIAITQAEEDRIIRLRDAYDAEQERKRQEIIAKERARVEAIEKDIASIEQKARDAIGKDSAAVLALLDEVSAIHVNEERFHELKDRAAGVILDTIAALRTLHSQTLAAEEAARAAAEAAERERQRVKLEQEELARQRAEQERIAAEQRAESLRLEQQRIAHEQELQRQREADAAAVRAEMAKLEAARKEAEEAARQKAEAIAQREREMAEREAKIQRREQAAIEAAKPAPAPVPETEPQPTVNSATVADEMIAEAGANIAMVDAGGCAPGVAAVESVADLDEGPSDAEVIEMVAAAFDLTEADALALIHRVARGTA